MHPVIVAALLAGAFAAASSTAFAQVDAATPPPAGSGAAALGSTAEPIATAGDGADLGAAPPAEAQQVRTDGTSAASASEPSTGEDPSSRATAAGSVAGASPAAPDPATIPRGELVLVTATGLHRFTVEIADDPVERSRGLMFRTQMAVDHGMLFDFGVEGPRSFWMKNTPLSLDMIFAAADGTVVSIARNTVPYSLDAVPSEDDARFVFEVNAGVADRIGLVPGDRLLHRRITR